MRSETPATGEAGKTNMSPNAPEWTRIGVVSITVGIFAVAVGLSSPLLALVLKRQDLSGFLIGANAAMMPIGLLISSICVPHLAQRRGAYPIAVACAATAALALSLMALIDDVL